MHLVIRRIIVVILGGSLLLFIFYLQAGGPTDPFPQDDGYPYVTSRSCRICHADIYDEWETSFHGQSWADPLVRNSSQNFGNVDCIPCHAPRPILIHSGLSASPQAREKLRKEGVSCLSCHRTTGGVAASKAPTAAPCRAERDERIGTVGLCKTCHNLHGTIDDWEKTPLKAAGRDCISCHMPPVKRKDGTTSKSHAWQGGHTKELVARAIRMDSTFDREKGLLVVTVENISAGHNIPTELRHRSLDLEVTMKGDFWSAKKYLYRFRNPYKEEALPNMQLKFGEKRVLTFPIPKGSREAKIRLVYRFMHRLEGSGFTVIGEQTVPFVR